jgi:hypothetical protein
MNNKVLEAKRAIKLNLIIMVATAVFLMILPGISEIVIAANAGAGIVLLLETIMIAGKIAAIILLILSIVVFIKMRKEDTDAVIPLVCSAIILTASIIVLPLLDVNISDTTELIACLVVYVLSNQSNKKLKKLLD